MVTTEEGQALRAELRKRDEQIALLTFQLEQLKRMIFGAKSERFVPTDPAQATLFGVEATAAPETEQISYQRRKPAAEKKQPVREAIAAHLPRVERVIHPENVPEGARKIGEEVTETLEYTPGTIHVDRIVRPKYVVDDASTDSAVMIAPMPSLPFPKSNLGASLAAHICVSKFADHLPLPYEGAASIKALLEGLRDRFGWAEVLEQGRIIGLTRDGLDPASRSFRALTEGADRTGLTTAHQCARAVGVDGEPFHAGVAAAFEPQEAEEVHACLLHGEGEERVGRAASGVEQAE